MKVKHQGVMGKGFEVEVKHLVFDSLLASTQNDCVYTYDLHRVSDVVCKLIDILCEKNVIDVNDLSSLVDNDLLEGFVE